MGSGSYQGRGVQVSAVGFQEINKFEMDSRQSHAGMTPEVFDFPSSSRPFASKPATRNLKPDTPRS